MKNLLRILLAGGLLAALVPAGPARSAGEPVDRGTFTVTVGDRLLGVETFSYEHRSDSLWVESEVYQTLLRGDGADTLRKRMTLVVDAISHGFKSYASTQDLGGHRAVRSVVARDTTFSSFRQYDDRGEGDVYALPPGRLFVLDGGMFSLFDVICRALAGTTFESRPLNLFAIGPRDSLFEGTVTDLGADTLRWGGRRVITRRLGFTDGAIHYEAWLGPDGHMLRLVQPDARLRVEREAPAIKPRAPRPRGS